MRSWEFPPSFLRTSSIDILRNRAQVCVKYLPIAKKLAFHIEFINRQVSGHKPAQHFSISSEEFAWKVSCATRGCFSPISYSLQQQRQPGVLQCPLWKEKLLRQLALEQVHSTSAHPISHLPQTCFNAWHLGLHGLPFESYTPEWHLPVDRIWQVRIEVADFFLSLLHIMFYFHLFWSCSYVSSLDKATKPDGTNKIYDETVCPCEKRSYPNVRNC